MKKLLVNTQRLIVVAFFSLFAVISLQAQCEPGSVCVRQATIDAATAAASELLQAREVIAKFTTERAATQAERDSAARLIDRLNAVIAVQDRLNLEYTAMTAMYKQVIQMQAELIERMSKQLNAPKSGWAKFLGALKTIANIAVGIAIGRGF